MPHDHDCTDKPSLVRIFWDHRRHLWRFDDARRSSEAVNMYAIRWCPYCGEKLEAPNHDEG